MDKAYSGAEGKQRPGVLPLKEERVCNNLAVVRVGSTACRGIACRRTARTAQVRWRRALRGRGGRGRDSGVAEGGGRGSAGIVFGKHILLRADVLSH